VPPILLPLGAPDDNGTTRCTTKAKDRHRETPHPNRAGKKISPNLLKHDFPKNISSIVEAKRLGKHDDNSVRIHVASRRMWL
jgi:hypothetical protein